MTALSDPLKQRAEELRAEIAEYESVLANLQEKRNELGRLVQAIEVLEGAAPTPFLSGITSSTYTPNSVPTPLSIFNEPGFKLVGNSLVPVGLDTQNIYNQPLLVLPIPAATDEFASDGPLG